ncbi:restriction endonuclease subunit S [Listeria booriae]|nr:restriction endonuclease subunit S [Listeria booriae]
MIYIALQAWEQRKLGDLVVDYVEKTSVQNQFPMLTSSQQKGIVLQEDYFANRQVTTENNIGYFVLPRGYFTFRSRSDNDVFVFNRNDIIDRGIISYFYPVFTLKSADSDFFLRRINNGIQRQLSIQAEGTGQHVLSLKKFKNIVAMFPSEGEQKKIGSFFKQLDDTIALHQRKLDTLQQMKKGFLQQMFLENGEKLPRMRFADFQEEWEQRKLGEFYSFKNGLNKEKEFFGKGTPIVNFTDVFHNRGISSNDLNGRVTLSEKEISRYEVKEGDIFFTRTSETINEIGYPSVMLDIPEKTVFSGFVLRGRANSNDPLNNLFKKYAFFTEGFRNEMITKSSMTTRALTSGTALKEMYFWLPKNKIEQQKIGTFFQHLDNTIALHRHELDQLNILKKACLQNMFI